MADGTYDVVVVGSGGAGLMAAFAAASRGRSVVVLEKAQSLGGTTALSVGTLCTSGTPHQKRAGISDCPEDHFDDMGLCAGDLKARDNLDLRRLLVEEVPVTFRKLTELGIEFVGPIEEPPHRVPRLHAIVPHSRGYIRQIANACRKRGVVIKVEARVEKLIFSDAGGSAIEGVEVAHAGGKWRIRAAKAVILASGDFSSAGRDFKSRFMSGPLLQIGGINPSSTGDGQKLGESAGGEIVNGDLAWGPEIRFLAPPKPRLVARVPPLRPVAKVIATAMRILPEKLLRPLLLSYVTTYLAPSPALFREGSILVNRRGERFCDERNSPQDVIGLQPAQEAFIVFDQVIAGCFESWPNFISTAPGVGHAYLADYKRSRPDIFHRASSPGQLARKIGVADAALTAAIKSADGAGRGLTKPPFYALGPAKSWIVFSDGGLKVDRDLRVLTKNGTPIGGLYAAGSAGQGGLILQGHGHHLAWAFTSGRLAGEHAALSP